MVRKAQGFAFIDLIFVCGIIGLLCSIALPRLLLVQQSAGAASAIGSMRTIDSAQLTFALTCGNGFYAPDLSTLGTPSAPTMVCWRLMKTTAVTPAPVSSELDDPHPVRSG